MGGTSVTDLAVRLLGSLGVVVGILFLLAKVANKRIGKSKGHALQIVARQGLSKSSSIAVVAIGSRVLVLGTTEQNVSVLAELDPEELDEFGQDAATLVTARQPDAPTNIQPFAARRRAAEDEAVVHELPLAGSLLSADTWKQTFAALKSV